MKAKKRDLDAHIYKVLSREHSIESIGVDCEYRILTFEPSKDPSLLARAQDFQIEVLEKDTEHKKSPNYARSSFRMEEMEALSLIFNKSEIVGVSSLYHRAFFGSGVFRCLNRYYVRADLRLDHHSGLMRFPLEMVRQQYAMAVRKKAKGLFLSIEFPKLRWISAFSELLQNELKLPWKHSLDLHLVCPDYTRKSCWQHIIYCEIADHAKPLLETKSVENFRQEFFI